MENISIPNGGVIMVVTPERARNYKWFENSEKLSPLLQVVSIDELQPYKEDFGQDIQLNSVWMKHPFIKNKYVDINGAEDLLTKQKLDNLGIIVRHLGVKRYETTYAVEEIQRAEYDASMKVRYKVVKVGTSVQIKKEDKNTGKYWREETFEGKFSQDSYNTAVEKAREFGLDRDEDIAYLIHNRDPRYENLMKNQNVKIELDRELNRSLDIAFTLNAIQAFSLDANYQQTISTRKKIIIETKLEF